MLGIPAPGSRIYQKGTPSSGPLVYYFVRNERLISAAAINGPRELREAKRLMGQKPFEPAALSLVPVG